MAGSGLNLNTWPQCPDIARTILDHRPIQRTIAKAWQKQRGRYRGHNRSKKVNAFCSELQLHGYRVLRLPCFRSAACCLFDIYKLIRANHARSAVIGPKSFILVGARGEDRECRYRPEPKRGSTALRWDYNFRYRHQLPITTAEQQQQNQLLLLQQSARVSKKNEIKDVGHLSMFAVYVKAPRWPVKLVPGNAFESKTNDRAIESGGDAELRRSGDVPWKCNLPTLAYKVEAELYIYRVHG